MSLPRTILSRHRDIIWHFARISSRQLSLYRFSFLEIYDTSEFDRDKSGLFFKKRFTIDIYPSSKKEVQEYFWMKWIDVCNIRVLQGDRWVTLYGLGPEERKDLGIAV